MSGMTSLAGENTASANGFPMAIKATSGAAHMRNESDYRGLYPNTLYAEQSGTGVNDNDILFTTADISAYNRHIFQVTAGSATLEVSVDGSTFTAEASYPLFVRELGAESTTPGLYDLVNTMASGKVYVLEFKVKKLRLKQDGATAATVKMASYVG
jgi:hypothetical protein